MNAATTPPADPALRAELRELQRRAYGPAGAGGLDAAELTRLGDLEAHAQAVAAAEQAPQDDAAEPVAPPAPTTLPVEPVPATAIVTVTPRHRRRTPVLAAAAVLGCALVGAGVAVAVAPPTPDAVLQHARETDLASLLDEMPILSVLDVDREQGPLVYEPHRNIQAVTFATTGGDECLIVSVDEYPVGFACGRGRLPATVQLMPGTGIPADPDGALPEGIIVRVVAQEATVELWFEEPEA